MPKKILIIDDEELITQAKRKWHIAEVAGNGEAEFKQAYNTTKRSI